MIELERLELLALGDLDAEEEGAVEEHVLACSACAAILERLLLIGAEVAELVRGGKVAFQAAAPLARRLEQAGLISRRYRLRPGQVVPCTVGASDVYSATELEADLRGARRVDLVRHSPTGSERRNDIVFDAEAGLVTLITRSDVIRTFPSVNLRFELFAEDASGERRLGEYVLEHTAYSP